MSSCQRPQRFFWKSPIAPQTIMNAVEDTRSLKNTMKEHQLSFLFQLPNNWVSWLHNLNSSQISLMAFNYSSHANNFPHCWQYFISKNVALRIGIHFNFSQFFPATSRMSLNSLVWCFGPLSGRNSPFQLYSPSFPTKPNRLNYSHFPEKHTNKHFKFCLISNTLFYLEIREFVLKIVYQIMWLCVTE